MKLKSTLIVLSLIAAPAFASDQASSKTREQVQAELAQAIRTGDIMAGGESGTKLNELEPTRYPAVASAPSLTRDQVKNELARAISQGELVAVGEDGRKHNEIYPDRYHAAHHAATAGDTQEPAE